MPLSNEQLAKIKVLQNLAQTPSSNREINLPYSGYGVRDSNVNYGQESQLRQASVPTKQWNFISENDPSEAPMVNPTDAQIYKQKAQQIQDQQDAIDKLKLYQSLGLVPPTEGNQ